MEEYFERFGGVRDYLRASSTEARQDGYTETILGRRRYLPDLISDNRQRREMAERMALNAPIQGSAADIIKVAMLGVDARHAGAGLRSRMLLQVHDELVFEVAPGERGEAGGPGPRTRWAAPTRSRAAGGLGRRGPRLERSRPLQVRRGGGQRGVGLKPLPAGPISGVRRCGRFRPVKRSATTSGSVAARRPRSPWPPATSAGSLARRPDPAQRWLKRDRGAGRAVAKRPPWSGGAGCQVARGAVRMWPRGVRGCGRGGGGQA